MGPSFQRKGSDNGTILLYLPILERVHLASLRCQKKTMVCDATVVACGQLHSLCNANAISRHNMLEVVTLRKRISRMFIIHIRYVWRKITLASLSMSGKKALIFVSFFENLVLEYKVVITI